MANQWPDSQFQSNEQRSFIGLAIGSYFTPQPTHERSLRPHQNQQTAGECRLAVFCGWKWPGEHPTRTERQVAFGDSRGHVSGHAGGIRIGSADFLVLPDKVDALVVAHDDALEAEFATQHIGEQPGIHMARDALDFLIGGHHPPVGLAAAMACRNGSTALSSRSLTRSSTGREESSYGSTLLLAPASDLVKPITSKGLSAAFTNRGSAIFSSQRVLISGAVSMRVWPQPSHMSCASQSALI